MKPSFAGVEDKEFWWSSLEVTLLECERASLLD